MTKKTNQLLTFVNIVITEPIYYNVAGFSMSRKTIFELTNVTTLHCGCQLSQNGEITRECEHHKESNFMK